MLANIILIGLFIFTMLLFWLMCAIAVMDELTDNSHCFASWLAPQTKWQKIVVVILSPLAVVFVLIPTVAMEIFTDFKNKLNESHKKEE